MMPVKPSKATARSAMVPEPTRVWLRPVKREARVGEQIAVVWNALYIRPSSASLVMVGVWTSPPKVSEMPKPTSSMRTMRMFGASAGRRWGCSGHFMVESCSLGLATLASIGVGGKGRMS